MELDIDKMMERMRKEEEIRCPFCDDLVENDDGAYPVSYGGSENGAEKFECHNCEKEFFVKENVRRIYDVAKTEEEL